MLTLGIKDRAESHPSHVAPQVTTSKMASGDANQSYRRQIIIRDLQNSWNLAEKKQENQDNKKHLGDIIAIMQVRRTRGQTETDKVEKPETQKKTC